MIDQTIVIMDEFHRLERDSKTIDENTSKSYLYTIITKCDQNINSCIQQVAIFHRALGKLSHDLEDRKKTVVDLLEKYNKIENYNYRFNELRCRVHKFYMLASISENQKMIEEIKNG